MAKNWLWGPLFCAFLLTTSKVAWGNTHIGLGLGLIQDSRTTSSKDTLQNTLVEGYLFTPLFKSKSLYLGVEYLMITTSMPNGADENTATLSASNPFAAFKLSVGKKELLAITLMGSPTVQANYNVTGGVANDLWTGVAFATKIALQPELSSNWRLEASIIYFSATYTAKSSTSTSSISSFGRSLIIPTLGLQVYFK
jgi:hypothetical protein